ncbi:DUF305 domain-containing protein [Pseudonocardia sp. MCCB 268]|nr:DUF305 domain-containing protein [Pseudonocardia cytotoxica]
MAVAATTSHLLPRLTACGGEPPAARRSGARTRQCRRAATARPTSPSHRRDHAPQQAVEMAELAADRAGVTTSTRLATTAIRASGAPEIARMRGFLAA